MGRPFSTSPSRFGTVGTPPTASFAAPAAGRVGEPVQFRCEAAAGDDDTDHVLWDFGAGIPATELNPAYRYEKPGAYRVSLVVWDKTGRAGRPTEALIRITGNDATSGDAQGVPQRRVP